MDAAIQNGHLQCAQALRCKGAPLSGTQANALLSLASEGAATSREDDDTGNAAACCKWLAAWPRSLHVPPIDTIPTVPLALAQTFTDMPPPLHMYIDVQQVPPVMRWARVS